MKTNRKVLVSTWINLADAEYIEGEADMIGVSRSLYLCRVISDYIVNRRDIKKLPEVRNE